MKGKKSNPSSGEKHLRNSALSIILYFFRRMVIPSDNQGAKRCCYSLAVVLSTAREKRKNNPVYPVNPV
jgi:hypothetical protein